MTSLDASQHFSSSNFQPTTQHYNDQNPGHLEFMHNSTQQSAAYAIDTDYTLYDGASLNNTFAFLPPTPDTCMTDYPDINVESATPAPLPPSTYDTRQDSVVSAFAAHACDWQQQQMYQAGISTPGASTRRPLKRARTHNRTPSASTVASNGPASPYTANTSYPLIANTDYSPNSPAHFPEHGQGFQKALLTPQQTPTDASFVSAGYIPSQLAHAHHAHLAMKNFGIDHHFPDESLPEFYQSSRHSMSSGHDSPATPQSHAGGDVYDSRGAQLNQQDYRQHPNPQVQYYRTESQQYQDDYYNPNTFTSMPFASTKPSSGYLSPHRNLVTERLQTANLARSVSPTSAMSRERSPFRDGSPLAPAAGTVAGMRQQQKEEAEQAEYAQHMPTLQREPTKTISPKDAVLDYHETDQAPLFQEQIPAGYRQHSSSTQQWDQNHFVGQSASSFGDMSAAITSAQQMNGFRATANNSWEANLDYMSLPPEQHDHSQIQPTPFQNAAFEPPRMNYTEATPQFPAQLTSMESSISEGQPPLSSQNSFTSAPVQRPVDTRANTGTYTCTYHGCTERFDSQLNLQRHKRDIHRSQQYSREATSTSHTPTTATDSASPRSTESPAPSGSGLTSAAILARNSQAGPHKCTRINPSTNKPCNTIFSRPYDLTRHEDTIHNGRKQKVRCPMCREEKTFSRNDALTRHMRVVHPEVESYGKRVRRE